jgi:exopolyphosphatase/guanosine-5'-triphosphate,3'-diphosphate pyrophosphatase
MPKYKVFAAIDVGSTAISMKIIQITKKNGLCPLDTVVYQMSLGKETYATGKITYSSVEKICGIMADFVRIMQEYQVDDYTAYATTAVREASNSEYIIDQINLRTGIKVTMINNEEEHFLHNKALALNVDCFDTMIEEGAEIIDVSSGSVQISFYQNSKLNYSQSVPMGSLRVFELLSDLESRTVTFSGLLEEYIKASVEQYKRNFFRTEDYQNFIIYGNGLSNLKLLCGKEDPYLAYEDLNKVHRILEKKSPEQISEEYEIPYESAILLLPTVLIYKNFLASSQKNILAPDCSLVDGICVEYAEKNTYIHTKHIFTNDIISSVICYADKYHCDKNHYEAVTEYAVSIFNALSKKFGLNKRDCVLLKVASILQDTGLYININSSSKYSYDIVKANSILGLSEKEHEIVAYTVLFQNGGISVEVPEYKSLSKSRKLLISKLSAILSLAKTLDMTYQQKIMRIKSTFKDGTLFITANTDEDITLESWKFYIAAEFFKEVFGIKTELSKKYGYIK